MEITARANPDGSITLAVTMRVVVTAYYELNEDTGTFNDQNLEDTEADIKATLESRGYEVSFGD